MRTVAMDGPSECCGETHCEGSWVCLRSRLEGDRSMSGSAPTDKKKSRAAERVGIHADCGSDLAERLGASDPFRGFPGFGEGPARSHGSPIRAAHEPPYRTRRALRALCLRLMIDSGPEQGAASADEASQMATAGHGHPI